jgi:polyisoprenoid-binding protein YceI
MSIHLRPNIASALVAAAALASSWSVPASAQQHRIDVAHSTITIHVFKSGLFRAFADNHLIQARLAQGLVEDSGGGHVDVVVDAQRLRVMDPDLSPEGRGQVQGRMLGPDVLDVTRFPQIRFHSTTVERLETDRWLVNGTLELHGRSHNVALNVVQENGHYRGQAKLRQTDFGIRPITVAGGAVKVKDELTVDFDIVTADR